MFLHPEASMPQQEKINEQPLDFRINSFYHCSVLLY